MRTLPVSGQPRETPVSRATLVNGRRGPELIPAVPGPSPGRRIVALSATVACPTTVVRLDPMDRLVPRG